MRLNEFDQPIGDPIENYTKGELPSIATLEGRLVRVEKLDATKHDLYPLFSLETPPEQWTYLPIDRFSSKEQFQQYAKEMTDSHDPYFLTIIDQKTNLPIGTFSLMRIDPNNRTIEMGWVIYSPKLKRTTHATEAQYLVMKYVFETLKYRRYEWKCDALNKNSYNAALRLGFKLEGIFRQAQVYKNRTRDTAWFSVLDQEWPRLKTRFERWLAPENFTDNHKQIKRLQDL